MRGNAIFMREKIEVKLSVATKITLRNAIDDLRKVPKVDICNF